MNFQDVIKTYIYQTYLCSIDANLYENMKNNPNIHYSKIWNDGKELGKRGWTIPLNTNPAIIKQFLEYNDDDLDKEVGRYISQDYKDGAYDSIINSSIFPNYLKRNFIETHKALENDLLYPATTGITAICEGYLSYVTTKNHTNNTSWKKFKISEEEILSSKVSIMTMYMYSSISGFIEYYFACRKDFKNINDDNHVNRHLLMHGRTQRELTIYDYFRVFNLLRLLLYMNECAISYDIYKEDKV